MFLLFSSLLPVAPVVRCEDHDATDARILANIPAGYSMETDTHGRRLFRRPAGSVAFVLVHAPGAVSPSDRLAMARSLLAAWPA